MRVRGIIELFFKWSGLGLLKAFGLSPSLVFSFLNNTTNELNEDTEGVNKGKDKVKVLVVQLLSSDFRMVFYKRSHLHPLRAKLVRIGLLDVPQESLERDEIKPFEVKTKEGGLAIIDGRLGFRMLEGVTIMAGFAVEEELKYWSKMRLPKTMGLQRKIKDMESERIGINVEFISLGLKGGNDIPSTTQPK
ncbi:hypothetical protein K469DRAFT_55505 [Zopfia rhizophila CBS 207.26]|uniref:Uncharacterized protein n=1 Tax=Zopfia rhizophila CBS 207.26 TaxID=1314779 RepID=A0A6A6D8B4_9PEZI|nr:hypothetical protein K469DRAFT_55505 [Zopfia rhizophila CBS 207.26]